ncbi:MAG: hypothetical protein GTN93_11175, partial [Anaerolineae bacterium]|nr:hypothetical protein [Anaerolineae bacterium]
GSDTWVYTGVPNPVYAAVGEPNFPWAAAVQKVVIEGMSPEDAVKAVAPDVEAAVAATKEEIGWEG